MSFLSYIDIGFATGRLNEYVNVWVACGGLCLPAPCCTAPSPEGPVQDRSPFRRRRPLLSPGRGRSARQADGKAGARVAGQAAGGRLAAVKFRDQPDYVKSEAEMGTAVGIGA
jgi:hypothetical protein